MLNPTMCLMFMIITKLSIMNRTTKSIMLNTQYIMNSINNITKCLIMTIGTLPTKRIKPLMRLNIMFCQ